MPKDSLKSTPLYSLRSDRIRRSRLTYRASRASTPESPSPPSKNPMPTGGLVLRTGQHGGQVAHAIASANAPVVGQVQHSGESPIAGTQVQADFDAHAHNERAPIGPGLAIWHHDDANPKVTANVPGISRERLLALPIVAESGEAAGTRATTVAVGEGDEPDGRLRRGTHTRIAPRRVAENAVRSPISPRNTSIATGPGSIRGSVNDVLQPRTSAEWRQRWKRYRNKYIEAKETIEALRRENHRLERSEDRLKDRLRDQRECLKDTKVEVEESRSALVQAEEQLHEAGEAKADLGRDLNRYRGWWITENHSLKAILTYVPKRKRDAGLEAIVKSSTSRFMTYSGMGSN